MSTAKRKGVAAPAAGGGIPGTTTTGAAEAVAEARAIEAEALVQPGGSIGDVLAGARAEHSDAGASAAPPASMVTALIVRALPAEGFRRAGRHWPREATAVAADELTFEQIEALLREPMLHVTLVGDE